MSWILEDRERQVLFRLTPSAFDDDRAWWGQSLATAYWQQGDTARARAYADSSLAMSRQQAEATPDDAELQVLYGLVLALAGKPAEARAAATRALALTADDRYPSHACLRHRQRRPGSNSRLGNKDQGDRLPRAAVRRGLWPDR